MSEVKALSQRVYRYALPVIAVGAIVVLVLVSILSGIQAHDSTVKLHNQSVQIQKLQKNVKQCRAQSDAWRNVAASENLAFSNWVKEFPYGTLDLGTTNSYIATAKGITC